MPVVFLGTPTHNGQVHIGTVQSYFSAGVGDAKVIGPGLVQSSLLAKAFNLLWVQALELHAAEQATHFLMLHADVGIDDPPGWLDHMIEIQQLAGVAVLSVVLPVKDDSGDTSTALDRRRLTLDDFSECRTRRDRGLLINTGCMLVDLSGAWTRRQEAGKLLSTFTINDAIRVDGDRLSVEVESEDWAWSRMLHRLGQRVAATTEIRATHYGGGVFRNYAMGH